MNVRPLLLAASLILLPLAHMRAQTAPSSTGKPEKVEWTWAVSPDKLDPALPNVLLVGDSITRAYSTSVAKDLAGKANVYLYATSTTIGDRRLPPELATYFRMIDTPFAVVHCNNGMHGWSYSEQAYAAAFPAFLKALHKGAPKARFVWTSTTPVRVDHPDASSNARIDQRNAIALRITAAARIPIDDQHALMQQHSDLHSDDVHYTEQGSELQAHQASESIAQQLATLPPVTPAR